MIEIVVGLLLLFFSMIVQVIIPPIPATLMVIAAGKLYGVLLATLVSGAGLWVGYLVVFYFAKWIKNRFPKLFDHDTVKIIIEKLKKHENLILWVRILPYNPADTISYAAGIIQVDARKFWINSFIVSFVRCYLLAVMGFYIENVETILQVVGLLLISGVLAYIFIFADKKKKFKLKKILKEAE